jgi:membrane protein implicated in regulation of membrane protease activity
VRLAKAEVREEATSAGKAAGMLAVGAVLGAYAVGLLLLTIVYALNGPLPDWLAALIVFAVVAIAAAVLAKIGLDRIKQVSPKPEQTIDSIKEDVQWVKQQTR